MLARAASGKSRNVASADGALAGLTSRAIRTALGTSSCISASRIGRGNRRTYSQHGKLQASAAESSSGGVTMTTLDDFAGTLSPTDVRTVLSFWQRWISSIASHRQLQADQYFAEYLRRHPEYQEDFGQLNRGVR